MPKINHTITDAELALLSLLAENPMHGYQIEQIIEERGMREWTEIGFSSIYYILDKLKHKGWLSSSLEPNPGKGPVRQIYRLTASGKKVWKEACLNALRSPHRSFSNFHLGLSNLEALDPQEVSIALGEHRFQLAERYERVKAKYESYGPGLPWHIAQLFDLSLTQIKCELDWVDRLIREFKKQEY